MAPKKWYAVRKGHRTGVFETWGDCQAATTGYSGAQYKGFKTRQEAEAYLNGNGGAAPDAAAAAAAAAAHTQLGGRGSAGAAAGGGKFYAVARGRQVGIFDSWSQTQAVVEGFTNPVYQSFRTHAEAAEFLVQHSSGSSRAFGTVKGAGGDSTGVAAKRQRGDSYQAPAPTPAFTGQQQQQQQQQQKQQQQTAVRAPSPAQHSFVTITFDGGSRNNPGRAGYGYAVFERQHNERLRMGCRPLPYGSTNNEAEYSGLIAGMRYCLEKLGARHIVARGDSQLVVRQLTGQYKVNGERLLPLYREAKLLQERCESFQIEHIYRDDNVLADSLSNLAMDSDAAADRVVLRWQQGAGRQELAALLAAAAQVDGHASLVNALRTAPCFMLAAAQLLAQLWDAMPVEEVTANLSTRGWDEGTGGPPTEPLPPQSNSADVAEAASGAGSGSGAGTSGVVAAAVAAAMGAAGAGGGRARGVVRGRGLAAVPVAPVTLGRGWAQEVGRQEALQQQQQQQQQWQHDAGGAGGVPATVAGRAAPRSLEGRPVGDAAAASVAAARLIGPDCALLLQQQRLQQRRAWGYSSSDVASMSCGNLAEGHAELVTSGRAPGLQRQQQQHEHQLFSRTAQRDSSTLFKRSSSSTLLRRSSSGCGSLRVRAGRILTAAAAAAAGRLCRREAGGSSSRRQRGIDVKAFAV